MTATPQDSITVPPQNGGRVTEKVTFYLRPDQLDMLEDLAYSYRKRTGKRITRNDVVRMLLDAGTLETLLQAGESDQGR